MFPSKIFENKRILVGISGGIAAYKICELIRQLVTLGAEVRVMVTKSAEKFITRYTLETLSGHPVYSEMFPEDQFVATHHIALADWAEAAIIAPATANIIGKLANGIGDDFVSTTAMALGCPVVIAPAMNNTMWANPAVQENMNKLVKYGYHICPPEEGFLAEGYSGIGRLARLEYLVQYLYRACHPAAESLKGKNVLVTAGRTEEAIDPVRIFTNRSTGKMGFAMAVEAFARGANVTLIYGPSSLVEPDSVRSISVSTATEMFRQVMKYGQKTNIFIAAAAVADFTPVKTCQQKIKKKSGNLKLDFSPAKDILAEMGKKKKENQILIGFAVETESEEESARRKLKGKNLNVVVLNNPLEKGAGFGSETNRVTLFNSKGEKKRLSKMYKLDIAREIFNFLLKSR
ncbi:MAG: bifunctional phosphopantothenoylcysteine decarboxylase/phosphopantothenate--cysteine ligase CoaBC [Calditrichia bacterium]